MIDIHTHFFHGTSQLLSLAMLLGLVTGSISLVLAVAAFFILCTVPERPNSTHGRILAWFWSVMRLLKSLAISILGESTCIGIERLINWIIYKPNPLFQIFYVITIGAIYGVFVFQCFPLLPSEYSNHTMYSSLVIAAVFSSYAAACFTPPTRVTSTNEKTLVSEYAYDNLLYIENNNCKTCRILKPARSKHCSICGHCIARLDHHCVWINQCVGRGNHKEFLVFLLVHIGLTMYGVYILGVILENEISTRNLFGAQFMNKNRQVVKTTVFTVFRYLLNRMYGAVFLFILAFVMFIALSAFFIYQLDLIRVNQTTNEAAKLSLLSSIVEDKGGLSDLRDASTDSDLNADHKFESSQLTLEDVTRSSRFYHKGLVANFNEVVRSF